MSNFLRKIDSNLVAPVYIFSENASALQLYFACFLKKGAKARA